MTVADVEGVRLERRIERGTIAGALIEFEERPPKSERGRAYRKYHYTPPDGGERRELKSVTTILGEVIPKDGLLSFYESAGAEGAAQLALDGGLEGVEPAAAVEAVRAAGLGARDRSRTAAARGVSIHALLEEYAMTGAAPNPADHPVEHRGYIRGLARWLLAADPEPIAVERLICEPDLGFAGRMDLRARVRGQDLVCDLKTNRRGAIYLEAHIQAAGYALGELRCGDGLPDGCLIVAVGEDGNFQQQEGICHWGFWGSLMTFHRNLSGMRTKFREANR